MEATDTGMRVERRGHVLEITLDRGKVNAIDNAMSRELGKAFVTLRDDPDLRVGLITGAGEKIFSAGWDLKALDSGDQALDNWWEIRGCGVRRFRGDHRDVGPEQAGHRCAERH